MSSSTFFPFECVHTDPEFRFSITFPSRWVRDTSGQQGTRVILFHPFATTGFRTNINVIVQQIGVMTPDDFLTLSRLQMKGISAHPLMDVDQPTATLAGAHFFEVARPNGPATPKDAPAHRFRSGTRVRRDCHRSIHRFCPIPRRFRNHLGFFSARRASRTAAAVGYAVTTIAARRAAPPIPRPTPTAAPRSTPAPMPAAPSPAPPPSPRPTPPATPATSSPASTTRPTPTPSSPPAPRPAATAPAITRNGVDKQRS